MKSIKFRIVFLFLFLIAVIGATAQNKTVPQTKDNFQIWEFMTRHTFSLKSVAQRFHVDEKIIKKLSKYRKKKVYPGRVLRVPVLVRVPVWNPDEVNPNQAILGEEVSRPLYEFEWDTDSLDPYLKEDFIILREVQADSMQLEKIAYQISRIDRYITRANKRLDSIKREEFAFDYDEADLNSVLQRMQEARQRYYKASPIGREVDSLVSVKGALSVESNRLQIRVDEYEFLHENRVYFQKTKGGDREKPNDWDMRIEAEERYLSRKQKHRIGDITALKADERKIIDPKAQSVATATKDTVTVQSDKSANSETLAAQLQANGSVQTTATQSDSLLNAAKTVNNEVRNAQNATVAAAETNAEKTKEKSRKQGLKTDESTNAEKTKPEKAKVEKTKEPKQETAEVDKNKENTTKSQDKNAQEKSVEKQANNAEKPSADNNEKTNTDASARVIGDPKEKPEESVSQLHSQQAAPIETVSEKNIAVQPIAQEIKPTLSANDVLSANQLGKQSVSAIQSDVVSETDVDKVNASGTHKGNEDDPLDKYEHLVSVYPNVSISPLPVAMTKEQPKYTITPDSNTIKKANVYMERFKEEMKNENVNKAENMLKKVVEINPNDAMAWCYHAELQVLTGNVHEAAREYVIAQTIQPDNPRPFYKMGVLYDLSNNTGSAHEYYTKAMRADPTYVRAFIARATLALKQGDIPAAISDYGLLVEANPSYVEGYKARGLLRMKVREYESAVNDFSTYIENADPEGEVPYWRGMAKIFLGNTLSGCEDFHTALYFKYELAGQALKKFCE